MKLKLMAAGAACALLLGGTAAQAAMIVHDPTSYAKLVAQAQTALNQLKELKTQVTQGEELFESLNAASLVNAIAPELDL
ncbi:MAG TPA: type IV secretion system protein, partial [Phenylobacterium sp.]|nr:type IV secretion system protein [Phenylobacterium sp.]